LNLRVLLSVAVAQIDAVVDEDIADRGGRLLQSGDGERSLFCRLRVGRNEERNDGDHKLDFHRWNPPLSVLFLANCQ
jgi:hypothetical protein